MISQSYSHLLLIYMFLEHWRLAGWRELEIRSLKDWLKASSNQLVGNAHPTISSTLNSDLHPNRLSGIPIYNLAFSIHLHPLDFGSQVPHFGFEVIITAIEVMQALNDRFAVSS
jgi:hypothetical protein